MGINEVLQWLLGSGGVVIAVSWICERWAWFQAKASNVKEWLFFGFTAIVWAGAYAVVTYVPQTILAVIQPWFLGISGLFVVVIVGKLFHQADKVGRIQG
jgi:hypothetical protein